MANYLKEAIKKVPIPICGVMLGLAALGNLLQAYGAAPRYICGIAACFLLLLFLLKLILFPARIKEDMQNPVMAGVAGTLPMGMMILTTYIASAAGTAALCLWIAAIATVFYLFGLINAIRLLNGRFYPGYAALTFPFVISAVAVNQAAARLTAAGHDLAMFNFIGILETIIAVFLVLYVFSRYMRFLFSSDNSNDRRE